MDGIGKTQARIVFDGVSFSFGRGRAVLRDLNFSAGPGECVVVAGTNGSGKTTLLTLAAGIRKPLSGHVRIAGRVGYVPQGSALLGDATVAENLRFFADLAGAPVPRPLPFEVEKWLDRRVDRLSGGMKKQVSIACAMAGDPETLLLDEPCGALDIRFRESLAGLIGNWKAAGKTILYVGHDPAEFHPFCDRMLVLSPGGGVRLVSDLPADERAFHDLYLRCMSSSVPSEETVREPAGQTPSDPVSAFSRRVK
ncbi:MAG: ABC transporter ATP-binding protein [Clostridia bacterium]|nr:ABC transporter ATP-binding protein [Clostridia bacterium]MBQ5355326.1 ABC transporter ATP-binding protein [Clostridia bacterium]